jgi:hypothetical protein
VKKWVNQAVIMALINTKKQVITVRVKVQMKLKIQAVHAVMVV